MVWGGHFVTPFMKLASPWYQNQKYYKKRKLKIFIHKSQNPKQK